MNTSSYQFYDLAKLPKVDTNEFSLIGASFAASTGALSTYLIEQAKGKLAPVSVPVKILTAPVAGSSIGMMTAVSFEILVSQVTVHPRQVG